jgi:hypothetical protein
MVVYTGLMARAHRAPDSKKVKAVIEQAMNLIP